MPGRVLITRSEQRSAELLDALRREGVTAICEPVTETVRTADAASLPDLTRVDWIAFTSVNAVTAFAEILSESGRVLPADIRLAAVGPATAHVVRQNLRALDVISGSAGGAALAKNVLHFVKAEFDLTLLWPCAQNSLPEFADALSVAGMNVIEWPIYATESIPPWALQARLERPSTFDAVVFAAPSAVKSLRDAWPQPWSFAAVAIGQTTADALRQAGVAEPSVSSSPRTTDVLDAILRALHQSDVHASLLLPLNGDRL